LRGKGSSGFFNPPPGLKMISGSAKYMIFHDSAP